MSMHTEGFSFSVEHQDGNARCGVLQTPNATIQTPVFMPVGTQATVKGLTPDELESTGARIILANTYHLWLRPGAEAIAARGGVTGFMKWPHALLTDSGGYQVFSLADNRTIDDDGVTFQSHLDGARCRLTPEEAMRVQGLLGADIAMVLDECPPGEASRAVIESAIRRTTAWARRSLEAPGVPTQARFVIAQGGVHEDLRVAHLEEVAALPSDGVALGGFSVGEPVEEMYRLLAELGPRMPALKPRYLMGVGTPVDLLEAISHGVDMFDCVLPTRNARNGQGLTWSGRVNLRQARHKSDDAPLDSNCGCSVCKTHSRAYLRHLFKADEMLGPRLVTLHNLHFYGGLMHQARAQIAAGTYQSWSTSARARMLDGDEIGPPT